MSWRPALLQPTAPEPKGMVPKRQGAGYLPTKFSASVSPVQTQMGDGPSTCTACPRVCKHPWGCEGAPCAACSACAIALHAHAQLRACMSPPATAAAVVWLHCSHTQVHVPPCTHTGLSMCMQAPLPWVPTPPGPLMGGPLAAPRAGATLQGECVHRHTHMCMLRCGVTHPAAVGKTPPGQGLPRCSCWVTARPNDAMSSFAYAKQHHCCRVPREEALPPAPRDPLGCPGMPTHLPCTHPPLSPDLHGFINSNYPH